MILPIIAYGHPVLRKKTLDVDFSDEHILGLINNMWDTMYYASGVGLAAPQVGVSKRLFIVDTLQLKDEKENEKGIKQVFINPLKINENGDVWTYEEGCLSIPKIRGDVDRHSKLRIRYYDQDQQLHEELFEGVNARVIQHEYDHLEGILFTDLLKPIKKRLVKKKLEAIKKGKVETEYELKFCK